MIRHDQNTPFRPSFITRVFVLVHIQCSPLLERACPRSLLRPLRKLLAPTLATPGHAGANPIYAVPVLPSWSRWWRGIKASASWVTVSEGERPRTSTLRLLCWCAVSTPHVVGLAGGASGLRIRVGLLPLRILALQSSRRL
jgi:hypothetical protein